MFSELGRREGQCGPDPPVTHIRHRHHADHGGEQGAHDGHGQEGGGGDDDVNTKLLLYCFLSQANTERPDWSEEEQQQRDEVLTDLGEAGGFSESCLKKQIMVDRSAPVVNGER